MKLKELRELIQLKNEIIMQQSKRIKLLEEKMTEIRQKYFRLKYSDRILDLSHHKLQA